MTAGMDAAATVVRLEPSEPRLATVTVTFQPDLDILARQLASLPRDAIRVVVDNGSRRELTDALADLVRADGGVLVPLHDNIGLAGGLNAGVAYARGTACTRVLLLDQDTEPDAGAIAALSEAFDRLHASGMGVGCVGPRLVDVETGIDHGFHAMRGFRPVRMHRTDGAPVATIGLNGSGLMAEVALFDALGGFDESLFIDHVDTEWSFRVASAGYGLFGIPQARFAHRMGARSVRFWWIRWRVWPYRTPARHRQLFRNAVRLMRRGYVPATWKFWAVFKLLATLVVHALFDPERFRQVPAMVSGVRDGLRAREGRRGTGADTARPTSGG
jgi:rhamnosyltransferase